jgi:hypothetical protein
VEYRSSRGIGLAGITSSDTTGQASNIYRFRRHTIGIGQELPGRAERTVAGVFRNGGSGRSDLHYSDSQFEKGPGRITLQLVKRGGVWRIVTLNFNSDLLIATDLPGKLQPNVVQPTAALSFLAPRASQSRHGL